MLLTDKNIVAIDDAPSIRTFLRISLQAHGATVHEASTAAQGLLLCKQVNPDLIVLDLGLPDRSGLDILEELKKGHAGKSPAIVILTVRKEQEIKDQAVALGADAYLTKPFMVEELLEIIEENIK